MKRWQAVLKLSHKNLFRVGFVRQVAIALVLAVSLSVISAPPPAAQSLAVPGEQEEEEEEPGILAYYRALTGDAMVADLADLVQAANDWLNGVIPAGFAAPITLTQLVQLANEWLGLGVPQYPQYGGRITVLNFLTDSFGVPDPAYGGGSPAQNIVGERMSVGDVYKYGARDTGEYFFRDNNGLPPQFKTGGLAESWEVTPDQIVLHIRPGVYFTGLSINPVMEKREYTADDLVYSLLRKWDPAAPRGGYIRSIGWLKEPLSEAAYAVDRYTVVIETNFFHAAWDGILQGSGGQQFARESIEAAPDNRLTWENMVGTGPFYSKEFIPGSHWTVGRNPYYWQYPIINGIEYETPFVDEIVFPMIADESTAIAALRTAKVDMFLRVTSPRVAFLKQTSPELISMPSGAGLVNTITFDVTKPPFDNIDVRRAIMISTDRAAVNAMLMEPWLEYNMHPFAKGWEGWVPIDEMPAETRLLYTYNPNLARQVLADAGYPDGFQMTMLAITDYQNIDIAEMVADQWSLLGIEVTITPRTIAELYPMVIPPAHMEENAVAFHKTTHTPVLSAHAYYGTTGSMNVGYYSSQYFDERMLAAIKEIDPATRVQMLEEANLRVIDDVAAIPFAFPAWTPFWWPWIKNFYGEVGYHIETPDYHNIWLDQDLKADMGY